MWTCAHPVGSNLEHRLLSGSQWRRNLRKACQNSHSANLRKRIQMLWTTRNGTLLKSHPMRRKAPRPGKTTRTGSFRTDSPIYSSTCNKYRGCLFNPTTVCNVESSVRSSLDVVVDFLRDRSVKLGLVIKGVVDSMVATPFSKYRITAKLLRRSPMKWQLDEMIVRKQEMTSPHILPVLTIIVICTILASNRSLDVSV